MTELLLAPEEIDDDALIAVPPGLRIVACPHPFSMRRIDRIVKPGVRISEILRDELGLEPERTHARVFVDDWLIPKEWWHRVKPQAGRILTIRVVPTGGGGRGGGGGGKNPLATILTIAVAVVAIAFPYFAPVSWGLVAAGGGLTLTGALVSAGIGLVGALIVNAIAPPPQQKLGDLGGFGGGGASGPPESPTLSVTGVRNKLIPYGVIPRVYGRHRLFPPLGAQPYTEIVGNDQFLRMLFLVGYGPLNLSDLKIGETPIANFQGVETETRQGYPSDAALTLFTNDVHEDALSVALTQVGGGQIRLTQANADEISVDIVFPQGLVTFTDAGDKQNRTVAVTVEYRIAGSGSAFTSAGTISATEAKANAVRRGLRWTVSRNTYEVRLTRTTADATDTKIRDLAFWSALRTIRAVSPVNRSGMAMVALRIKATDQLNGVIDEFNLIAESILPDWNGSSWAAAATSNPASIYRNVLQGTANARPLADARLDLETLQAWHTACASAGRKFNAVIDFRTTVFELLRDVAAVGRAAFGMRDGKYSVVMDIQQSTPIQHFTPRNSSGFRGVKVFADLPHALNVRFVNPDKDWQQDERIVYDDGYSAANATKFEVLELFGVTDPAHAYKDGRYHIAVGRLRPETYELHVDIENLVCTRGDLIRVTHDVPLWGLGWARVKSVTTDGGGNATAITIDDLFTMEAGKSYSVRIRKSDGTSVVQQIVTAAGEQSSVTFTTPIAPASIPAVGDLVLFGELNAESVELLVKNIEPGPELTAKLVLIDHSPAIYSADTGTIPAFQSQITRPPLIVRRTPAVPIIDAIRSDEEVLVRAIDGSLESAIEVAFHFVSGDAVPAAFVQVHFRRSDSTGNWIQIAAEVTSDADAIRIVPVVAGVSYDFRLRAVTVESIASDWTTIRSHTVIGKSTPPPDVTGLYLERTRDRAVLRWVYASPPKDFAGFHVRQHAGDHRVWEDAIPAHGGLLAEAQLIVNRTGGTRSFLVKAVDTANNESANAAVLVAEFLLETEFGDPTIANLIETIDHKALGFPGVITNGSVIGGNLQANDNGALFWTNANNNMNPFWQIDGTKLFWIVQYLQMQYLATLTPEGNQVGTDLQLVLVVVASSQKIEYRFGNGRFWDVDGGKKFWSTDAMLFWIALPDYIDWPGKISDLTRQNYELRLTTGAGVPQGVCSQFDLSLDVPDLEEEFKDLVIAAPAGTRPPITKIYRAIKTVQATLQDDGGAARSVKIIDKNAALGPLIKTLDSAGAATAGLIDARLKGY